MIEISLIHDQLSALHRVRLRALACLVILAAFLTGSAHADTGDFLLVRRSMQVQPIRLTAISDQYVEHLPQDKSWEKIPLKECVALLNPQAAIKPRTAGMLLLADGQRLPGEAWVGSEAAPETLAWSHPWLGRVDVPLKLIDSMVLTPTASAPAPGELDVVLLANGDRQEGLVMAIGSSITLEVERAGKKQNIDIPIELVSAITMIAGKQPPTGKRIWFDEGSVIDVQSIAVGDDGYVRLSGSALVAGTQPTRVGLSQIAAILLDPQGMIPLATLAPSRIEGPATRYMLPKPQETNPNAPLNLSSLQYQGPLVVRYALPVGVQRFVAEAELPRGSMEWGDYELIIRSNDAEVFRGHLNAANPAASINVALAGRELTIEIAEAGNGPIQDQLLLHRPMLLMAAGR